MRIGDNILTTTSSVSHCTFYSPSTELSREWRNQNTGHIFKNLHPYLSVTLWNDKTFLLYYCLFSDTNHKPSENHNSMQFHNYYQILCILYFPFIILFHTITILYSLYNYMDFCLTAILFSCYPRRSLNTSFSHLFLWKDDLL